MPTSYERLWATGRGSFTVDVIADHMEVRAVSVNPDELREMAVKRSASGSSKRSPDWNAPAAMK
jgi:hypothetical protein